MYLLDDLRWLHVTVWFQKCRTWCLMTWCMFSMDLWMSGLVCICIYCSICCSGDCQVLLCSHGPLLVPMVSWGLKASRSCCNSSYLLGNLKQWSYTMFIYVYACLSCLYKFLGVFFFRNEYSYIYIYIYIYMLCSFVSPCALPISCFPDLLGPTFADLDLAGGAPQWLRRIQRPIHQVPQSSWDHLVNASETPFI